MTLLAGTTLDAIRSGFVNAKYVCAIEGYEYLLTDASTTSAIAAWAGTDWTQALGGLFVEVAPSQQITPWNPFQSAAGKCILRIQPDSTDRFGIDTHRRTAGAETYLTATVDRAATTIPVKDTSGFASSGTIYIGTESIAYTSVDATNFLGCTRGQFSPFLTARATNFAEHHRVGTDALGVELQPVVSAQPRVWIGKWIGVWKHTTDGTNLNAKSDAVLVFAGRITSIADDPNTSCTVVEIKHVLEAVNESSLGRDMWSANVTDGITIFAGDACNFEDWDTVSASHKVANPLTVKASGASGANQINAGIYTLDDLASAINSWLSSEKNAGRLYGTYTLDPSAQISPGVYRAKMHWYITSTATEGEWWFTSFPWAGAFGILNAPWTDLRSSNTFHDQYGQTAPNPARLFNTDSNSPTVTCNVVSTSGAFVDQYSLLPASVQAVLPAGGGGLPWGVFLYNETLLFVGTFSGSVIDQMQTIDTAIINSLTDYGSLLLLSRTPGDPLPPIRQVLLLESTAATMLKYLFYGTGTSTLNSSTFDTLGYGLGIGIPGSLLDTEFEQSCDAIPGADAALVCVIDKTTKLSDAIGSDLLLRLAFLRWKSGHLEFCTWVTPTADASIAALDETNKATPSGTGENHRSATIETDELVRDIVKIAYNRDFTSDAKSGTYANVMTLEDRVDVDDTGGEGKSITINARNVYGQFQETGAGITTIAPNLLASFPLFSRPKRKSTRSIDIRSYEDVTVGDVVVVSDHFARDPGTGQRGIAARPAMITRHTYDYGGFSPADSKGGVTKREMTGEVDLFFLDLNRVASYVPCVQVDAGATNAGYDATNHILTVLAHEHSESSESADAANFSDGDKVLIVEIDPADPAAPLSWQRTIAASGISGNTIKLTSALSSPAWDSSSSKRYRVIFDHFTTDQTTQQTKAFQALESAGSIESTGAPYQYGIGQGTAFTSNGTGHLAELHSTLAYGDGKARDVGYERGIVRTLNNLVDFKTNRCSPMLSSTILENTTYSSGAGYQLQAIRPVFLGLDRWPVNQTRYLKVAPMFRSSTGASVTIRVTLCPSPTTSSSKNDVTLPSVASSKTWTTTSTTWQVGAEQDIDLRFKPQANGIVWVHIETTIHGQTRLLAQCQESKRS